MKKVLLATTNNDKYRVVKKMFERTIFKKDEYEIESLKSINVKLEDKKEEGDNLNRAYQKALQAKEELKDYDFDYIVGLDDAIRTKGELNPNIKLMLNKILYEGYLKDNEEYSFERAYVFLSKDGKEYKTRAEIPYYYKENKDVVIEEYSYPLSYVAYAIGYDKAICDLEEEDEINYYLRYVQKTLEELNIE